VAVAALIVPIALQDGYANGRALCMQPSEAASDTALTFILQILI